MKINESLFEPLNNGKEMVKVLKEMAVLKPEDSPFPLYEKLLGFIAQTHAEQSVPVIFPYLAEIARTQKNIVYLNFVANTKLGFYHRGNLSRLTPEQIREYLASLYNLRKNVPLITDGLLKDSEEKFKSLYLWNGVMLHSYSKEAYLLSRLGQFESPFKVQCRHCGNSTHSLYIDGANPEKTESITPAEKPEPWEKLFCDDLYPFMMSITEQHEEKFFSKVLPYLYGTYTCSVCEKENQVIDALGCYVREEQSWFVAPLEMLLQMEVVSARLSTPAERWEFVKFVVAQYRVIEGIHSPRALSFILRTLMQFWDGYSPDMQQNLKDYCLKEFTFVPEDSSLYGDLQQYLGNLMEKDGKPEVAQEYYDKSLAYAKENFGLDAPEALGVQEAIAFFKSRQLKTGKEAPLLEVYDLVKKHAKDKPIRLQLFRLALRQCYEAQENFVEAVKIQEELIADLTSEERLGEFQNILGALYLKAGEKEKAKDTLESSLNICLKAVGMSAVEAKFPKKIKKNNAEQAREATSVLYAALSCYRLAEIALEDGEHKTVTDYARRGSAVLDWGIPVPVTVKGDLLMVEAENLKAQGKDQEAKTFAEKALKVYELTEKRAKPSPELVNGLERARNFLK